ncbi:MAG TPA: hypothetical protein P5079_09025, partial [Elusimicrobiota bacterium]|nr:hypothetical protein [Elusimicrobiota bacterium]
VDQLMDSFDGLRMEFSNADGEVIGGMVFNKTSDGSIEVRKLDVTSTTDPETGETTTTVTEGAVIGKFTSDQLNSGSARLTFGVGADGKSVVSFSVDIVQNGARIGQLNIAISVDDTGKQTTSYAVNFVGKYAVELMMDALGVTTVDALMAKLDGVTVEAKDAAGNVIGGYQFNVENGKVQILTLDGEEIVSFTADQLDLGNASLTIGMSSDGSTILALAIDIRQDGKVIGSFMINLVKGTDGIERLSYLVTFKGEMSLIYLMRALGINPEDPGARTALFNKLDGSKLVISQAGSQVGGYGIDFDEASGTVKIYDLKKNDAGQWVLGAEIGSFNLAEADWSTATISFGIGGDGEYTLGFSLEFKRNGQTVGTFNVSMAKDKDGIQRVNYAIGLQGAFAREVLMKILGIDPDSAGANSELWEKLDGAEMIAYDKNGHVKGGYRLRVEGDNVYVTMLKADPDDSTKAVETGEEFKFGLSSAQWTTASLTLGQSSDGSSLFGFSVDLLDSAGNAFGTFGISMSEGDDGEQVVSYALTFKGQHALKILMEAMGVDSQEALMAALDDVQMVAKDKDGNVLGGYAFHVDDNGTVHVMKLEADPNDPTKMVEGEELASFGLNDIDWKTATLTIGRTSGGDTLFAFSASIRQNGRVIGTFTVSASEVDGRMVFSAAVTFTGEFALNLLMSILGVKSVDALMAKLDGVQMVVQNDAGEVTGGYEIDIVNGRVSIYALEADPEDSTKAVRRAGGAIGTFAVSQINWASCSLTLGTAIGGDAVMAFSADVRAADGNKIGTFNVSMALDEKGIMRLNYMLNFTGQYALDLLMDVLGVDTREELLEKLDGSNLVVKDGDGKIIGGYSVEVENGKVTIYKLNVSEAGVVNKDVMGPVLMSFDMGSIDWGTVTLSMGTSSDGEELFGFSADIRQNGRVIGRFSISIGGEEDQREFSFSLTFTGERARELFMKILGIDPAAAGAERQLWAKLNGAEMVAYDKKGNVVGGYRLEVAGDTVHIIKLKADPKDSTKTVDDGEIGVFDMSNVNWDTASFTIGQTGTGGAIMAFSVDIRDASGRALGIFSVGVTEDAAGERTVNYSMTFKGAYAVELLMKVMGVTSREALVAALNGVQMVAKNKEGEVIGGYSFRVDADGTVHVMKLRADPNDNTKAVEDSELFSFNMGDIAWDTATFTVGRSSNESTIFAFSAALRRNGVEIGTFSITSSENAQGQTVLNIAVTFTGQFALDLLMDILGVSTKAELVAKLDGAQMLVLDANGDVTGGYEIDVTGNRIQIYRLKANPQDHSKAVRDGAAMMTFGLDQIQWATSTLTLGVSLGGDAVLAFSADIHDAQGIKIGTFSISLTQDSKGYTQYNYLLSFTGAFATEMLMKVLGVTTYAELMQKLDGSKLVAVGGDGKVLGGYEVDVNPDGVVTIYKLVAGANGEAVRAKDEAGNEVALMRFDQGAIDWASATLTLGISSTGTTTFSFAADIKVGGELIGRFGVSMAGEGQKQYLNFAVAFTGKTAFRLLMQILNITGAENPARVLQNMLKDVMMKFEREMEGDDPRTDEVEGEDNKYTLIEELSLSDFLGIGTADELTFGFDEVSLTIGMNSKGQTVFAFTVDLLAARSGEKIGQISIAWDAGYAAFSYTFSLNLDSPVARHIFINRFMDILHVRTYDQLVQALSNITFTDPNGNEVNLGDVIRGVIDGTVSGTFTFGVTSQGTAVFSFTLQLANGRQIQGVVTGDMKLSTSYLVNGDVREVYSVDLLKKSAGGTFDVTSHYALHAGQIVQLPDESWGFVDGHQLTEAEARGLNDKAQSLGAAITNLTYNKDTNEVLATASGPNGTTYTIGVRAGTGVKFGRFIGAESCNFGAIDGVVADDEGNLSTKEVAIKAA